MELVLILDTLVDPTSRGIRGASSARHLLFHSEEWDLDLLVSKSNDGINLTGQVLPRGRADPLQPVQRRRCAHAGNVR